MIRLYVTWASEHEIVDVERPITLEDVKDAIAKQMKVSNEITIFKRHKLSNLLYKAKVLSHLDNGDEIEIDAGEQHSAELPRKPYISSKSQKEDKKADIFSEDEIDYSKKGTRNHEKNAKGTHNSQKDSILSKKGAKPTEHSELSSLEKRLEAGIEDWGLLSLCFSKTISHKKRVGVAVAL